MDATSTVKSLMLRIAQPTGSAILRPLLASAGTRSLLNVAYGYLPGRAKVVFSTLYARTFQGRPARINGNWVVKLLGTDIVVPLREASIDNDWNFALSLLAHDREVTRTYEAILHSSRRPALFVDLGANSGLHSLMMSKLGVRTIAVEPNPYCGDYAAAVFKANDVHPTWHRTALGPNGGTIVLQFPEGQTWLGTTVDDVAATFDASSSVQRVTTDVRALDDLLRDERPQGPVLIKIDVEGSEVPALRSGGDFIARTKPTIVFEANDRQAKLALTQYFDEIGYAIYALPYDPAKPGTALTRDRVLAVADTNFAALPTG